MSEEKAKNEKEWKRSEVWKKEEKNLLYISRKEFRKHYPKENIGYYIDGAVGEGLEEKLGFYEFDGIELPVYKLNYNKKTHKIAGYLQIDEDTFCVVIKQKKKWFIL